MEIVIRSEAARELDAQRQRVRRRPEAIRSTMAAAGRGYVRDVVTRFMSGRGGKTAGLSETALAGLSARGRAKQIGIARSRIESGALLRGPALGLNRISKRAAAGWVVTCRIEGDTVRLVVAQTVPYVRFHTDTYVPKGLPRRNPMRLPSGALWRDSMSSPDLAAALQRAGFVDA